MTTYLLDANVLITPYRSYYPFDFAKYYWDFLLERAMANDVSSIDKVGDEILRGGDELSAWFDDNFRTYCIDTQTEEVLQAYQTLVNRVNTSTRYSQRAKDEFMEAANADTWLLAYCLAEQNVGNDICIVTFEVYNNTVRRKVPIPNICEDFNLDYCDCFELLRRLNFSFHPPPASQ